MNAKELVMHIEEEAAFNSVMQFLHCYEKQDIEGCLSALTNTRPLMLLGTNEGEVFCSVEEVHTAFNRDFGCMNDIRWGEPRHVHVVASDTLASVIIELPISYQTAGKNEKTLFRHALTLHKEDGLWKICGGMTSVPFSAGTYSFK
jgi:hypothetical protein